MQKSSLRDANMIDDMHPYQADDLPNVVTDIEIDKFISQARASEDFTEDILREIAAIEADDVSTHSNFSYDAPVVYEDSFADEIRRARTSPERPPEVGRIKFRSSSVSVIDTALWVASAVSSGVLGNAAWEALKEAAKSYRSRSETRAKNKTLTLDEAQVAAYHALALARVLGGAIEPANAPFIHRRSVVTRDRWEIVFECAGHLWLVGIPHTDPMMTRVSIKEKFPETSAHFPRHHARQENRRPLEKLRRLLRALRSKSS